MLEKTQRKTGYLQVVRYDISLNFICKLCYTNIVYVILNESG